jgi:hypothetical protein
MEITLQKGDFTAVEAEVLVLFHFEQDGRSERCCRLHYWSGDRGW